MEARSKEPAIGDRVRALRRPEFPQGVIVQLLDNGFLLVRWQGQLLETAHRDDVELIPDQHNP